MTRPTLFQRGRPRRGAQTSRARGRFAGARIPASTVIAMAREQPADPLAGRVRDAGGPVDMATYICGCGLLFSAPVSTTVICPHCGCEQAW